ncbi:hypothetical protein J2789_006457 [Variovorax paradoxus]|nr:hypothetical protein [Variovorax paradoxus]
MSIKSCVLSLAATIALAACGGGGGGGGGFAPGAGGGGERPAPVEPVGTATVNVEPLLITANFAAGGTTADGDLNSVNVRATVSRAENARFAYLDADAPVTSSTRVTLARSSAGVFTGVVSFRPDLAPNAYSGAFKFRLCVDQDCVQEYSTNVASVPYQITVDAGANIYLLSAEGARLPTQNYYVTKSGTQLDLESNTPVVWSVADVSSGSSVAVISQSSTRWSGRIDVPPATGEAPPGTFNLVATPVVAGIASKSVQIVAFAPYR